MNEASTSTTKAVKWPANQDPEVPGQSGNFTFCSRPREKKKSPRKKKKVKKKFRAAREKQKKHQKSTKTPPKNKTKTPTKHQQNTTKKKFRADARKISPNAHQKSQFPWPRRGHCGVQRQSCNFDAGRHMKPVSECSGGFKTPWRFRNVLAVSECSGGFGMFWWFRNVPVV